ncbi:iron chelate uptake ABC transporter family permease subunit [Rosenbergiella sp. S61]|uniref:Iron chelate uptake ABC transporter family permease subunit n=1 Tax=Rosenbergiella gaditana TaxID=2726987 RepID=A0ABS5SX06_9GAMM|nr:iron chelate uptake ABC transporter family permease subunit [Rosenbergiella gaditana]MBT0724621.1 iron chelate uptake ABC transporter family permease subunit [Rosenbergiella gaditana]
MKTRPLIVFCFLLIAVSTVMACALCRGAIPLSLQELWQVLGGKGPEGLRLVVVEWRLPRVLIALMCGASLGISGAIFQSILRNPLGSPDVLGLNAGAFSGVLAIMLLWPSNLFAMALASLISAALTGVIIYLLAWRQGITPYRLILIGIGIRALLMSFNGWVMTSTSLSTAMSAGLWSAGSLNGVNWQSVSMVFPAVVIALLGVASLAKRMGLLEMGDDLACALGIRTERTRLGLLLLAILLTAVPTAVIGPVSFVALVAPQIARRLAHSPSGVLWNTALCGSLLLLAADYLAQHAFLPYQLPVGVITVSVGGIYLLSLLVREARRS